MNRRFAPTLTLALVGLMTMIGSEAAEAGGRGRMWFGGGGGVRIHAGASVHWSSPPRTVYRPRGWSVGGSIHVGTYPRYRYYRPYYYYPTYVPSYYGASYYPVAPAAAPSVVAVVAPRPDLPKLGIGLFAGGASTEGVDESSDLGVLGRLRLGNGGLLVEGELGKTSYANDLRVDRRLGASLIYEFGARNRWAPYILAGMGVQQADVAGEYNTTQNFGELGVGIRWAISPKFHLAFDVRAGSRNTLSNDDPARVPEGTVARTVAPPSSESDNSEEYTRARLSALLYF